MANTIAIARGVDNGREKETYRLGSQFSEGIAQTWRLQARARVDKDESGILELRKLNGRGSLASIQWEQNDKGEFSLKVEIKRQKPRTFQLSETETQ